MRGSHGTCTSFAQSIRENGFRLGAHGRLGKGAYFWLVADTKQGKEFGDTLARAWHFWAERQYGEQDYYKGAQDRSCSVISATLSPDQELILDFDDVETAAHFYEFFEDTKNRYENLDSKEKSNIRDEFVTQMEEVGDFQYDAILGVVEIPTTKLHERHIAKTIYRSRCAVIRNLKVIELD